MSGSSPPGAWIDKARQDARSAKRLLADPSELETAAYHVQQAVEKAAKAFLTAQGVRYPRERGAGHDLYGLARLIPVDDPLHERALALAEVTSWATAYVIPPTTLSRSNLFQRSGR